MTGVSDNPPRRARQAPARRMPRPPVLGFLALAIAAVVVAAWFLAHTQANQRRDVRDRYADRTKVASSLVSSLVRVAYTGQIATISERFATTPPTRAALDALNKRNGVPYSVVADPAGHVLAASSGTPPSTRARLATRPPDMRAALRSLYGISDVQPGNVVESALAFRTAQGQRVLVQGTPVAAFRTFLTGTLKPLPSLKGSTAQVLDGHGNSLGGAAIGRPVPPPTPALARAAMAGSQGSYSLGGTPTFVASQPLPATRWRVVVTVPETQLYATVSGPGRWLPWLILAIGAIALVAVATLVLRVLRTTGELAAANEELRASRRVAEARARELERSNADLEQFAYAASHDLSEPLRTVAGFSGLLRSRYEGRLDDDADEYIDYITGAVERMQRLIDDLLVYSRAGRGPAADDNVSLDDVLDEVLESLGPSLADRDAQVTRGPLPTVRGARAQLIQVLQNLLANGVKFTAPGVTPQMHVAAAPDVHGWRISVRDNGIGVDDPDHIFKMFGRLHPADEYPGTGIGLALAKRIVEARGGRIWVEPAPDGGSVFSFTVPAGVRAEVPA